MSETFAPTIARIESLAQEALRSLPADFRAHLGDIRLVIEDFPSEDVCREMELESPFDILGLYVGVSLDRKSVSDVPSDIDRIYLYRRPLLDYWCETDENLYHLVRHVLIHEIGHHFGFSDDDMEQIEANPG